MRHQLFYLISPRKSLLDGLSEVADGGLADLREKILWSSDEPERSDLTKDDWTCIAKLIFLASIANALEKSDFGQEVLGGGDLTEVTFDKWWTIERLGVECSIGVALRDAISVGTMKKIGESSRARVKKWIDYYRENPETADNVG